MITFGQLFLAVSLPTLVALIGIIFNQVSVKDLNLSNKELATSIKDVANELKEFRIEMARELGEIKTRIAVIETKMNIAPPVKSEPTKDVAA